MYLMLMLLLMPPIGRNLRHQMSLNQVKKTLYREKTQVPHLYYLWMMEGGMVGLIVNVLLFAYVKCVLVAIRHTLFDPGVDPLHTLPHFSANLSPGKNIPKA